MPSALLLTALLMGLAGSVHCAAMCGAGAAAIGPGRDTALAFHAGRLVGYAAAGALVALAADALGTIAGSVRLLRPFWALAHAALLMLGLVLLLRGRQPRLLDAAGHVVWRRLRLHTLNLDRRALPLVAGLLWALLPCGLLYSALTVAALAGQATAGAAVMLAFGITSAAGLVLAPLVRARLPAAGAALAVRLAGLLLVVSSGWALVELVTGVHRHSVFCAH